MTSNITEEHIEAFNALQSGCNNFALFSCFVDGEPASAIVVVNKTEEGDYTIVPLFVSVTPKMKIEDHHGVETRDLEGPA